MFLLERIKKNKKNIYLSMGLTCDLKETVNSRNKECGLYPDYNNIVFVINFSTDYIIKIT